MWELHAINATRFLQKTYNLSNLAARKNIIKKMKVSSFRHTQNLHQSIRTSLRKQRSQVEL